MFVGGLWGRLLEGAGDRKSCQYDCDGCVGDARVELRGGLGGLQHVDLLCLLFIFICLFQLIANLFARHPLGSDDCERLDGINYEHKVDSFSV